MTVYIAEEFTPDEGDILRRYFTNLDGPVFALVNLPEVVKGALFARYSRSWGLWLLLLVAPVGARFWIPDENARTVVISVNDHAPVMTSAMLGVTLGIVITTLLLPVAFIYLRSNATRRQPSPSRARPRVAAM